MSIQAVILAGGYSKRAGTYKMTLDFGGKPLLLRIIDTMLLVCESVIVVGGYRIKEIERLLEGYEKVKLVFNEHYDEGMFSSVKRGIREVNADRFFLTPGDYPLINEEICVALTKQIEEIVIPSFMQRGGHPILLSSRLIPEILAEPNNSHLKNYLSRKQRTWIQTSDQGILLDIDTMEDYQKAIDYKTEREKLSGFKNKVD